MERNEGLRGHQGIRSFCSDLLHRVNSDVGGFLLVLVLLHLLHCVEQASVGCELNGGQGGESVARILYFSLGHSGLAT